MMRQKHAFTLIAVTTAIIASCADPVPPTKCDVNVQCESGEKCVDGICTVDPCFDGIQSDGESDVDCGRACARKCEVGKICLADDDCAQKKCVDNVCIDYTSDCKTASAGDVIITEVLNNAVMNKTFDGTDAQQTEFFEIVNISEKKITLDGLKIRCQRLNSDSAKPEHYEMSGCLDPMGVVVISNTDVPMPEGGVNLLTLQAPNQLTNNGEYTCKIVRSEAGSGTEETLHTVSVPAGDKSGVSAVLENLLYTPSEMGLIAHTQVSRLNHSPGYCSNGRLYKNHCETLCHDGIQNEEETDVDCGGKTCGKCAEGRTCVEDDDCLSGACKEGVCQPQSCVIASCPQGLACDPVSGTCHSCGDHFQNGDESDVDCGGLVCKACDLGRKCVKATDCASQNCAQGICQSPEVTCANGQKDESESDVDCGGTCDPCQTGFACTAPTDCSTGYCDEGTCGHPKCSADTDCTDGVCEATGSCTTCSDGLQNGSETDVDCGGQHCEACPSGHACQANIDCLSYQCHNFVCEGEKLDTFKANEIVINEVMGSPKSGAKFSTQPNTAQCEFVEIVSLASGNRLLTGWSLNYQKRSASESEKPISVPLSGVISPKGGVVASNCASLPLPEDMKDVTLGKTQFVNGTDYLLWLEHESGEKTEAVLRKGTTSAEQGQSQTREEDLSTTAELVFHKRVSGLENSPGYCANGGLFSKNCVTACNNGVQDEGESDIDCGGTCGGCDIGLSCNTDKDCASENCSDNVCAIAKCKSDADCPGGACQEGICISCSDGLQNGDETDIDCGGSCPNACDRSRKCQINADCKSDNCHFNICDGTDCAPLTAGSVVLTEFMNYATGANMSMYDPTATQKPAEFIELVNLTDSPVNLRNAQIEAVRQDKPGVVTVALSGCIPAHQALVVSGSELSGLPPGVVNLTGELPASNAFTHLTGYYKLSLVKGDVTLHTVTESDAPSAGISRATEHWNATADAPLVDHTTLNTFNPALKHSPGYCTNGALYINDCKSHCENGVKDEDESAIDCGGSCSGCGANKTCHADTDCLSGECKYNLCVGGAPDKAVPDNLHINEVMAAEDTTASSTSFFTLNGDNIAECKFIEIVNVSGKTVQMDGCSAFLERTDGDQAGKKNESKLTGNLKSKGVLVIHNCTELPLPAGTLTQKLSTTNLSQTGTYKAYLTCSGTTGKVTTIDKAKKGTSMNVTPDLNSSATSMVQHTTLEGSAAVASPGYCANGKTFSTQCQ